MWLVVSVVKAKTMSNNTNLFFRAVSFLFPTYAVRLIRSKYLQRAYSGADTYPSSEWYGNESGQSANEEITKAQKILISRSRELTRNNPYAKKAIDVIVSNVVGYGIQPKITGRNKTQTKELNRLWKYITESSKCDIEGRNDFFTLQALAMRTIVESGEVICIKHLSAEAPRLQLLEPDFIDTTEDTLGFSPTSGSNTISGITVNKQNKRLSYKIYDSHPGDALGIPKSNDIKADRIIHAYRVDRPGQLRGVPWSHAVINTLKDFDDYQYATIVRQKISACMVGVITSQGDSLLSDAALNNKRKRDAKMVPGTWKHLNAGEDAKFSTPPSQQGYSEFISETIRAVACGYGITYEALSNDYSRVNFSSGRMGHLEMRKNFEAWRWNIIIPHFCIPYMELFLQWCKLKGVISNESEVSVDWVPPSYSMIDPAKEINAEKEAVKAGFKSKAMVIREQGLDPDVVSEEIEQERLNDKAKGLNFDVYIEPKIINDFQSNSEEIEQDESNLE